MSALKGFCQAYWTRLDSTTKMAAPRRPQKRRGDLLEVVDGGASHLGVEEEGGALDLLTDEEAESGEHGHATVGDLDVGVALSLGLVDAVEEAEEVDALGEGAVPWTRPALVAALMSAYFLPAVTLTGLAPARAMTFIAQIAAIVLLVVVCACVEGAGEGESDASMRLSRVKKTAGEAHIHSPNCPLVAHSESARV